MTTRRAITKRSGTHNLVSRFARGMPRQYTKLEARITNRGLLYFVLVWCIRVWTSNLTFLVQGKILTDWRAGSCEERIQSKISEGILTTATSLALELPT